MDRFPRVLRRFALVVGATPVVPHRSMVGARLAPVTVPA
jgi:hypothetical protein